MTYPLPPFLLFDLFPFSLLNPESLLYLVKVLKSCAVPETPAPSPKDPNTNNTESQPTIDDTTIFTTKLLTEVILLNKSRILSIW